MVSLFFKTIFTFLTLGDIFALLLILLRSDRKDFYIIFEKEFIDKMYYDLLMLIIMCYLTIWITIPISIDQIINDIKNKKK